MIEPRAVLASPLNLRDVFARWSWRDAIFLTYTFDLPFFEAFILPSMLRGGGRSIAVAACTTWLPDRLRAWADADEIREAGRSYTLSQVATGGVFHPKVILAVSDGGGLVAIGSGNLSSYGMATGGELFTLLEWSGPDVPALAQEAWRLCRGVADGLSVDRTFGARVDALAATAPGLSAPILVRHLLHNLDQPILDQLLVRAAAGASIERLTAWSPFTDRRLDALRQLVTRTSPSGVTIAVQPGVTSIDGSRLVALREAFPAIDWDVRELVPRDATGYAGAMIHAKGILLVRTDGSQLALIGSPNLSAPALLHPAAAGNLEAALVHEGPHIEAALFGPDSPFVLAGPADVERLTWEPDETTAVGATAPGPRLVGARLEGSQLALEIDGDVPGGTEVVLDRTAALPFAPGSRRIVVPGDSAPALAELAWPGGRSGPVVIANAARLAEVRTGGERQRPAALDAIDYGADADILALLDEMARLGFFTIHDAVRALSGRAAPTPDEEAQEAAGTAPAVRLDEIDFDRIRQHPRARAYVIDDAEQLDWGTPRIVVWLDEVAQQYASLWERANRSTVAPEDDAGEVESDADDPDPGGDAPERHPWPVSRRVRILVRNRLTRIAHGLSDPRLWAAVEPAWMTMNHAYFASVLSRFWDRAATSAPVITPEDAAPLAAVLMASFWGDDRQPGFVARLDADERASMAALLVDKSCDSLLAALALRALAPDAPEGSTAAFAMGGYIRAARALEILDTATVERALVWLGRPFDDPAPYVERLDAAASAFSWDRFASTLAWRHGLDGAAIMRALAAGARFTSGDILSVRPADGAEPATEGQVLQAWVDEVRLRDPGREVIHMAWNNERVLIYDVVGERLYVREPPGAGFRVLAEYDIGPDELSAWRFHPEAGLEHA